MDFDRIETLNRDRMIGATRRDARLRRRKVDVAARLARQAATAETFTVARHHDSVCSPTGLAAALDYDVIFSCVDRPWPRAVLNTLAYADLIPVIDGGIAIDAFETGGMRGATRRAQTATPGRPCLACTGQIDMSEVALEMSGDLDDPEYIRRAGREPVSGRPNVAALCAGVSGSQLEQFVSSWPGPAGLRCSRSLCASASHPTTSSTFHTRPSLTAQPSWAWQSATDEQILSVLADPGLASKVPNGPHVARSATSSTGGSSECTTVETSFLAHVTPEKRVEVVTETRCRPWRCGARFSLGFGHDR